MGNARMYTTFWLDNLKGRNHMDSLCEGGRLMMMMMMMMMPMG
jgi:hypothetical protein